MADEFPKVYESETFPTSNSHVFYKVYVVESSVNVDENYSNVSVSVVAFRDDDGDTSGYGYCRCYVQGTRYSQTITFAQHITAEPTEVLYRGGLQIPHTNGGLLTLVTQTMIAISSISSEYATFSPELTVIPRYATVSITLYARWETILTYSYATDKEIDQLYYSFDDGSTWTEVGIARGTSGTFGAVGLTQGTSYTVKVKVRRADSGLYTISDPFTVSTLMYPYATELPSMVIGEPFTVTIYNPLNKHIGVWVRVGGADYAEIQGYGQSVTFTPNATLIAAMYATIPNSQTGTYSIKCVPLDGGVTNTVDNGVMTVNPADCLPVIGTVAYEDEYAPAIAITHDDQLIIRNISKVKFTASGLSGTQSATVASCSVTVNEITTAMTLSGSTANVQNVQIDSAWNVTATVTVTDSRGISNTKDINVDMLDWVAPTAIITLERQNNFYTLTYITVDAQYSYLNGENTIAIAYKAKQTGTSTWTVTGTLQDNVQGNFNADNTYGWDIEVTVTDVFTTTTYNLFLSRGMPIIYFDRIKSSVGINCFPKDSDSFEVDGLKIWETVYPVNSVYMSVDSTSPATLFGGTWVSLSGFPTGTYAWKRTV